MHSPSVAIIVINWNTYQLTFDCLKSLGKMSYKNHTVFLVDNGSVDGSGDKIYTEFPKLNYIKNTTNLGFSGGNNGAIKQALKQDFDYVLLLNSDTEVKPNFLSLLVNRLEADITLAAVQPLILNYGKRDTIWNAGGTFNTFFGLPMTRKKGTVYTKDLSIDTFTDWISGCCILVKTDVIKEVGLLDVRFFAYFEDVDWSIRMKAKDYQLGLEPRSIIYHHESGSSKKNNKSKEGALSPFAHYLNVRNHIYLIKKHATFFNSIGTWVYQVFKMMSYTIYFILRGRIEKLKMVWRGVIDGLKY
ncbi:MAG: glycosyltransferase family 2 protein [Flavobacteriales bacterium]|nr:glycosyltransferase family 2 protein [Flavobacteriales bacterium]